MGRKAVNYAGRAGGGGPKLPSGETGYATRAMLDEARR